MTVCGVGLYYIYCHIGLLSKLPVMLGLIIKFLSWDYN